MGLKHRTVLYYLWYTNVFCMVALCNRTRSNQAGRSAGFAPRITMSSVWPKPVLSAVLPLRVPRLGIILLPFFWIAVSALAQENLPPALETKIGAGVQALKSGDLNSADEVFSDALRQGIKHPLIYHNLGVLAQLRGNHAEAVTRFRQALSLQPNYGPSRLLLGSSLLALHRNSEAVRELKRAVDLSPGEAAWHNHYGWYLGLMGRFDEGMAELKRAQALDPLNAVTNSAIAIISYWAGHNDLAIEQMQFIQLYFSERHRAVRADRG